MRGVEHRKRRSTTAAPRPQRGCAARNVEHRSRVQPARAHLNPPLLPRTLRCCRHGRWPPPSPLLADRPLAERFPRAPQNDRTTLGEPARRLESRAELPAALLRDRPKGRTVSDMDSTFRWGGPGGQVARAVRSASRSCGRSTPLRCGLQRRRRRRRSQLMCTSSNSLCELLLSRRRAATAVASTYPRAGRRAQRVSEQSDSVL